MTLEEAISLARRFHEGAMDKAGRPYVEHPLRVMDRVSTLEEKLAAVMHDLLEDTALSSIDLAAAGCPARVLQAIDALTRREGEPYEEFVARAAAHPVARAVKLADIADNSDPTRLAGLPPDEAARLEAKYAGARAIVEATEAIEPEPPLYGIGEDDAADGGPFARFDCATCGHPAGRVEFQGERVVVTSPLGRVLSRVERERAATVRDAVLTGDLATLRRFDYTPFWCPACPASYCHRHWTTEIVMDEGFYDCTYGTCPSGHRTMLDD
jgi:hypothetical protein